MRCLLEHFCRNNFLATDTRRVKNNLFCSCNLKGWNTLHENAAWTSNVSYLLSGLHAILPGTSRNRHSRSQSSSVLCRKTMGYWVMWLIHPPIPPQLIRSTKPEHSPTDKYLSYRILSPIFLKFEPLLKAQNIYIQSNLITTASLVHALSINRCCCKATWLQRQNTFVTRLSWLQRRNAVVARLTLICKRCAGLQMSLEVHVAGVSRPFSLGTKKSCAVTSGLYLYPMGFHWATTCSWPERC